MPDTKIKPHHQPAKSFLKSRLSIYFLVPSCLSGYKSIMQNKPNSQNPRIPTIPFTPKTYANIRLHPSRKNKAKQTQSRHTGKASRIEYPASSIQPCLCKTNPIPQRPKPTQPSFPQRVTKENHHWPLKENKANQTQFQNGQYKHKYSKNKGLFQRTTNNEQRTLSKTNPIKPNSPPSRGAIRNTQYTIRDTRYEPCTTAAERP
jgi:hypothetical protein